MQNLQLHDSNDNPKLTYAQNLVFNQRGQQLVLGSVPTSPLEITGAYAAVANGGMFNAPAPVKAIEDQGGSAVPVKRTPGVRVLSPQVAAQAATILTGDTSSIGTSASVFSSWYGENSSLVAGKTGTAQANKQDKNSSVWFVGMTPKLVAASAIIDFDNTFVPSAGLVGEGKGQAYGDFAAKVWLHALEPTLVHSHWSWPDPATVGGNSVPVVLGQTPSDARQTLSDYGYKMVRLGGDSQLCPSREPYGTIAFYGPQRAAQGATITVCVSSGVSQIVIIPKPSHSNTPSGASSGSTGAAGSSTPAGGSSSTPTGHGHGHGH
jgi:membrane peptidoglycan carboxypeptidase